MRVDIWSWNGSEAVMVTGGGPYHRKHEQGRSPVEEDLPAQLYPAAICFPCRLFCFLRVRRACTLLEGEHVEEYVV